MCIYSKILKVMKMQKSEIIRNNIAETSNNNDQNKQKKKPKI